LARVLYRTEGAGIESGIHTAAAAAITNPAIRITIRNPTERRHAMTLPRRRFLCLAVAAAALPAAARASRSDAYPSHPITMVVPVPAGGQMDSIARIVAERMRTTLSQPIIVENVTGASGTIGVGRVVRATADGYTLLYGAWATQVVNGAVYALQYDLINDFEPIGLTSITPCLIAAKNAVPANELEGSHRVVEGQP
jgi:tripartite-type tricarboxylate transporter receptor subunit TctC